MKFHTEETQILVDVAAGFGANLEYVHGVLVFEKRVLGSIF
jgi:hypothetical protein